MNIKFIYKYIKKLLKNFLLIFLYKIIILFILTNNLILDIYNC